MTRIRRTAADHAASERDAYARMADVAIGAIDADAKEAARGSFDALTAARWANAVDNASTETIPLLATSAQLAWVALNSVTADATTNHVVAGRRVAVGAGLPPELFRNDRLVDSLWAATGALDAATATRLARFDPGRVGERAEPDELATFAVLAAWWTSSPQVGEVLIAALETTGDDADDPDRVLDITVPVLAAIRFALADDAEGVRREVSDGAELFDAYWAHGSRADEAEGFLALGLTGVTALARASGLDVSVDHAVIPTAAGSDAPPVVLCPRCAEPTLDGEATCTWCAADLAADAPIQQPFRVWWSAGREPCPTCAEPHHPLAVECWSCHSTLGPG